MATAAKKCCRSFIDQPAAAYFDDAGIPAKILYNSNALVDDTLSFRFYDPQRVVLGKTMEEWLRFAVCFWHTFRGTGADAFGSPTLLRPWDDGTDSLANAKRRVRVAFEFFSRLGVKFYTFHDRDVAPEGRVIDQTNANLDEVVELMEELQKATGIRLLWNTCNLFSHPRYMNGAATNPDAHVFAYAGAQAKKGLEVAKRLGAENFVFWGGREGYNTLLNTDVRQELDHLAAFLRMAVNYKHKVGFRGQLLIEPKPKEPTKHQYDYDTMTVLAFLHEYNLEKYFKLNIEPNHTTLAGHDYLHDLTVASAYKMLGSIDANTGSPDLGWDTDQFPSDIKNCTLIMKIIVEQDGLAPGGLNFDAKIRRESTDTRDLFVGHIGAMDCLARGLLNAAKIIEDNALARIVKMRYLSFEALPLGGKIAQGTLTLEECEEFIRKNGEPEVVSGQQEHFEAVLNRYL